MTELTATQITELTSDLILRPVSRAATKAKAVERFNDAASLAGFEPPAILAMSFDDAKAAIAAGPAPKKTKPKATGGSDGRANAVRMSDDHVIRSVVANPLREGTKAHAVFGFYKNGQTVTEFVAAVKAAGYTDRDARISLSRSRRKGYVEIGEPVEALPKAA